MSSLIKFTKTKMKTTFKKTKIIQNINKYYKIRNVAF